MSSRNHASSLAESQLNIVDSTNSRCALNDSIEHRLHVGRRAADYAEHLGGCGLMLQRLAQFRITFAKLLEQSNVLNGDNGLVGKSLKQFYLSIVERTNFLATNIDHTDCNTLAKQWCD